MQVHHMINVINMTGISSVVIYQDQRCYQFMRKRRVNSPNKEAWSKVPSNHPQDDANQ